MLRKWISIYAKLPPVGMRVLVHVEDQNSIVISKMIIDKELGSVWQDDDFNTFNVETVDYWMTLPPRPKESEEEVYDKIEFKNPLSDFKLDIS